MMDVLDVTDWRAIGDEQVGTKPKQWLFREDDRSRWLWKEVETGMLKGGLTYFRGDDWAECMSMSAARSLGLPCAEVNLATRDGRRGVICRDFCGADVLVLGNELLYLDGDYPSTADRFDPHYTIERVLATLDEFDGPASGQFNGASSAFIGYLVLDGWIGNTDRHHQNWGVLVEPQWGEARLAPTFDHGSSLGFLLHDDVRMELLQRAGGRTVEGWADKAKTPFAGRPHPRDVALHALSRTSEAVARYWFDRLEHAMDEVPKIAASVAPGGVTTASASFAERLMRHNGAQMLSHPLRTLVS